MAEFFEFLICLVGVGVWESLVEIVCMSKYLVCLSMGTYLV